MNMDSIGTKVINTANYTMPSDNKLEDNKKDENIDTTKGKGVTQDLGKDTFVKSSENEAAELTYKPLNKKLSIEEIKALKQEQENIKSDLIIKFISDTIYNQNKFLGKSHESAINEMSKETTDLLTKIFGSVENAYPPMATTPEGAKEAISEGGAYSVDEVADRIMKMAVAIAGDDPDKLQKMRAAVEKGFSEAGIDFKKATNSDLPQISKDTVAEVMRRFDELQNKTSSK